MLSLVLAGLALMALPACATLPSRKTYPTEPDPQDPLSTDPCTVNSEPDILIGKKGGNQRAIQYQLQQDLADVKKIKPELLCGLNRIEILDHAGFEKHDSRPHVSGHYDSKTRVIRLKNYSRYVLFHEIGHHAQNLGYFWKTTQEFFKIENSGLHPEDNFISPYAGDDPKEDWAETFAMATAYPLMTGLRIYAINRTEDSPVRSKSLAIHQGLGIPVFPTTESNISVGESVYFPKHESYFHAGDRLFLYDARLNQWSQVSDRQVMKPSGPRPRETKLTGLLPDPIDISLVHYGENGILLHRNANYFTGITASSPMYFYPHDPTQLGREIKFKTPGTPIGQPYESGGRLWVYRKTGNDISVHALDPQSLLERGAPQFLRVPKGFRPLHVMPLAEGAEFLVLGKIENQKKIAVYRLDPNPGQASPYRWIRGGEIELPYHSLKDMRLPVQEGRNIIIPFGDFRFVNYDLKRNQFSLIESNSTLLPHGEGKILEIIPSEGWWYAVTRSNKYNLGIHQIAFSYPNQLPETQNSQDPNPGKGEVYHSQRSLSENIRD